METELKKWLKYLKKIESLVKDENTLTEYQKEDIMFTKKKIEELEKEIYK